MYFTHCPSHCLKSNRIRSYFGLYFPAFWLNMDQNNSEYGNFLLRVHIVSGQLVCIIIDLFSYDGSIGFLFKTNIFLLFFAVLNINALKIKLYSPGIYGTRYWRMDHVKFSKIGLPQISLSPFFNTLSHILLIYPGVKKDWNA